MTKEHNTQDVILEDTNDLLHERIQGDHHINQWSIFFIGQVLCQLQCHIELTGFYQCYHPQGPLSSCYKQK